MTGSGPNCSDYSTWRIHKASSPYIPEWLFLRPYINNNYLLPKFDNFLNNNAPSFSNSNILDFFIIMIKIWSCKINNSGKKKSGVDEPSNAGIRSD